MCIKIDPAIHKFSRLDSIYVRIARSNNNINILQETTYEKKCFISSILVQTCPRNGDFSTTEYRGLIHVIPSVEHAVGGQEIVPSEEIGPPINDLRAIEIWPIASARPAPTIKIAFRIRPLHK